MLLIPIVKFATQFYSVDSDHLRMSLNLDYLSADYRLYSLYNMEYSLLHYSRTVLILIMQ